MIEVLIPDTISAAVEAIAHSEPSIERPSRTRRSRAARERPAAHRGGMAHARRLRLDISADSGDLQQMRCRARLLMRHGLLRSRSAALGHGHHVCDGMLEGTSSRAVRRSRLAAASGRRS